MTTITAEVVIAADRRLSLELPQDCPVGPATLTLTPRPGSDAAVNRARELYGQGRGKIRISDDFDEPLNDFAEYM